jgi:hypothetical protein
MTAIAEMLEQMRDQRKRTHERLQNVAEEQMLTDTTYGERAVTVRFMFYRLVAHQVEHTVHPAKTLHGLGIAQGEAELSLKNLQAASGELEGMLVGLTSEDLDRVPSEGEWPVRRVVEHILATEESYSRKIEDALNGSSASS